MVEEVFSKGEARREADRLAMVPSGRGDDAVSDPEVRVAHKGDHARASRLFAILASTGTGNLRAAGALWLGRLYQMDNENDLARQAYTDAAAADPGGYYSLRATDLLNGHGPFVSPLGIDWSFNDPARVADRDVSEDLSATGKLWTVAAPPLKVWQTMLKPASWWNVEHTFTGSGVRWVGRKYDDAGQCELTIDGKKGATVDQYDPVRDTPFRYELRDLPAGQHTIRLTLLPDKNPASKNRYANVTGFDVVRPLNSRPDARRGSQRQSQTPPVFHFAAILSGCPDFALLPLPASIDQAPAPTMRLPATKTRMRPSSCQSVAAGRPGPAAPAGSGWAS